MYRFMYCGVMELSPFPHQGPLSAVQVRGREGLIADLLERATARKVTALLGPRRFGKTSVLRKVAAIMAEAGSSVVWMDLYETSSVADLVVRVDAALAETNGPMRRQLGSLAAAASINLGMFKVELARPAAQRPDPEGSLHLVLDLLIQAAISQPTVIVIDEFSGIAGVKGAAGLLRTKLQHHVQDIGLLFAGSEPSAMAHMFTDRAQPFYAQADIVEIQPFSVADLDLIITEGFESTDRDPAGLAAQVHQFTGGHPYRAMQLADAAWNLTPPDESVSATCFGEALELVESATSSGLETLFSSFASSEQAVLRARSSDRPIFGGSLELFGSSSGAVSAARDRLIADGTLDADSNLVDPLLAHWIRRRFPL